MKHHPCHEEGRSPRMSPGKACILDRPDIGVLIMDRDLRLIHGDTRAAGFPGDHQGDLAGKEISSIFPELIVSEIMQGISRSLDDHTVVTLDIPYPGQPDRLLGFCFLPSGRDITILFQDVTREKQVEEELIKSEANYQAIFNAVNDAVFIHDAKSGAILDANVKMTEMYGYSLEEACRLTVGDLSSGLPPYTQEGALEKISSALRSGDTLFEWQARDKSGRVFWVEVNLKQEVMDSERRIVAVVRDITEVKKAKQILLESNEELERKVLERTGILKKTSDKLVEQKEILQTIIDKIPVMLVFYDSTGQIRFVNKEFERIIGWSLEEVRDMDLLTAFYPDPDYRKEVWEHMLAAMPGWKDFKVTSRSGKVILSSWANIRLSDSSQIGIGIDISRSTKLEHDLLRLATAISQAAEGIVLFSPEGAIEYVNPAYEHLYGYSREELTGKTTEILGKEIHQSYQEIYGIIRETGKSWIGRRTRTNKNGEPFEVNLTVSPVIDPQGKIINFVSISRDVTHEMKLQQHMNQTQKMEALGTLAGGIAHDLKNVLTPILINTEIALEDIGADNPAHPALKEALGAAKLGRDLVNQILTFSRQAPPKKKPVNISSTIRETLSFLRASLPATVEIRPRIEEECVIVVADSTQIKQVLINLGSNAKHAMRERGGILEVELTCIDLDEDEAQELSPDLHAGPHVRITVGDTGCGMNEKVLEHIFEPFFTTKKKGEGTGMGLAVTLGIVKEHHGAVTVRSSPGVGSAFTVLLPRLKQEYAAGWCAAAIAS
jgi:PAS domain S-box-containing protein